MNINQFKSRLKKIATSRVLRSVLALLLLSSTGLSAQIKPISVLPLPNSLTHENQHGQPIPLENDHHGFFYFNCFSGDTLIFKNQSATSISTYFIVTSDIESNDDLQHCLVKNENSIILLNRHTNSIESYHFEGQESVHTCKKLSTFKLVLEKNERPIRIEKDQQHVYLVSYNVDSHRQNFYELNANNSTMKLRYSHYDPFVEIFFLDPNVSNYSFYNHRLALTDFYTGNTLIVDLLNAHVDSIKFPEKISETTPLLSTFERLNNKYQKSSTMSNYLALTQLVHDYHHVINSYLINDSMLIINVRFKDPNLAPFDVIGVNLTTEKMQFKQRRISRIPDSETVNLSNIPIYLGFEESNYIGDGKIYIHKSLPELNQFNLRDFLNAIGQHDGPKISNFVTYGLK